MTVQFSVAVRNGWLDNTETTVGASPKLQIRTGARRLGGFGLRFGVDGGRLFAQRRKQGVHVA